MSSPKRIAASRANGAKSPGPKTPEGKARSSQNAWRHGLLADCILIEGENRDSFFALVNQYMDRFHPVDDVEMGFIEEMAAAYWRMRRGWTIEKQLLQDAFNSSPGTTYPAKMAGSWNQNAATGRLDLIQRYETRLQRIFQRALNNLLRLRQEPQPKPDQPLAPDNVVPIRALPNEPRSPDAPIAKHPSAPRNTAGALDLPCTKIEISPLCASPSPPTMPDLS